MYKMVDGMCIHKSRNINIVIVMKNPEILKSAPEYLQTNSICKHVVKKFPYLLR